MKHLIKVFREFIKKDFRLISYATAIVFVAIAIVLNYYFKIKILQLFGTASWLDRFLNYVVPCTFSWYSIWGIHYLLRGKKHFSLSASIIWKPMMIIIAISMALSSGIHKELASITDNAANQAFSLRILTRLRGWIWIPFFVMLIRRIFDRTDDKWYGIMRKPESYKPYFFMLLIMVPLVILASTQPDFIQAYPRYKPWQSDQAFGLSSTFMTIIFESSYGLDFVLVEWIYRGMLVIGVSRLIGKQAVLPAAVMYSVMHFGKPMAEAISSLFGGYLLGIVAWHTRSIRGGIIVHLGLAWMMELTGLIRFYYFS